MIYNLLIVSTAVAGTAMLWGRLLKDSPWLQRTLRGKIHRLFYHALECPFCFTFWTALFACLIFSPLSQQIPLRGYIPHQVISTLNLLVSWMVTGVIALGIRTFTEYPFRMGNIFLCMLKRHPLHRHEEETHRTP